MTSQTKGQSNESVTRPNALPELIDIDLATDVRILIGTRGLRAPSTLKLRGSPGIRDDA